MNQLLFEGRSLAGIVSSIIRQDALRVSFKRLDWEHMFRLADYHRVANIVYLGTLGHRESLPDRWQERFFERYQESLIYGENYKESVKEVLTWLDMRSISCTILGAETIREFYRIPEAADTSPLQLLLTEENYTLVKGYLIDLGYETDLIYEGTGERLKKISSVPVVLYYKLPFKTAEYDRQMRKLLETATLRTSCKYIRVLSVENEFIYRMAAAAYRYVTDELTMREVLDLQLFHRVCREHIRPDYVKKGLTNFQINDLAEKILRISYMWFSDKNDNYYESQPEDMSVYDVLEDRLLTRGIINHETDEDALRLQRMIQKELDKEKKADEKLRRKERRKERLEAIGKWWRWVFPDYHYMASIYPRVEKMPVLLPAYWIVRCARLLWRALTVK